jgi:hypothetical protein
VGKYWGKHMSPPALSATNSAPRPGDFPLGSVESRAVARALADGKTGEKEILRVEVVHIATPASNVPASSRYECENCIVEIIHRTSERQTLSSILAAQ